jgi:hypothetical protein
MALLLRIISKPKWVAPDWMAEGDVPAEALTDLRADNNELSVWGVEPDRSDLNAALAAVASNRKRLDKLDYTLLDEGILPAIPIKCVRSEGTSPHPAANATMHRDLVELTVRKVAHLAHQMMPLERVRVTQRQVEALLREALQNGAIDRTRVEPKLLNELESTSAHP